MQKLVASPLFNVSLLSIFWALQIFIAKLAFLAGAELFTFSIQSVIGTAILLACFILPRKMKKLKEVTPKIFVWLWIIGALSSGLGATLGNAGVKLTTATNAGFLYQFDIAITIILAWLLLREKLNMAKIITLIAILVGTFLFTTNGQLITPHIGDIFVLLACVCFASSSVLSRKIFKQTAVDPDVASLLRPLASIPILFLAVFLSPLYPESIRDSFTITLLNFNHIFYVFLNSIFIVGIIVFLNRSLKISSASYTAIIASVTPILVAILGITFLHESLTSIQLLGALFIISASLVTHLLKVDKH